VKYIYADDVFIYSSVEYPAVVPLNPLILKLALVVVAPPNVKPVALVVAVDGKKAAKWLAAETVTPVGGTRVVTGNATVNHAVVEDDSDVTMPAAMYGFAPLA
jgi:hypothetical protein